MISQEDYKFIVAFDVQDSKQREQLLAKDNLQCAKTFLNLLGHVSKDQTLQYILVLVDDMLQVCEKFVHSYMFNSSICFLGGSCQSGDFS